MNIEIKIINSFSIDGSGGNPAGVVLGADNLRSDEKQLIASKANLSEVAFLSHSRIADYKVEFFTPTKQIAHCGHATIAAFSYLKSAGLISGAASSKETVDGTRQIFFEGDQAYMQQSPAQFFSVKNKEEILRSLGAHEHSLHPDFPMMVGNAGNSFLLVGFLHESDLFEIKPNLKAIEQISNELNCIGYYVFAQTEKDNFDAQARMFAPAFGIDEESATGMAAGPLGSFLYRFGRNKKSTYSIGQGRYMTPPSPSRITVNIDPVSGNIIAGGNAYVKQTLQMEI